MQIVIDSSDNSQPRTWRSEIRYPCVNNQIQSLETFVCCMLHYFRSSPAEQLTPAPETMSTCLKRPCFNDSATDSRVTLSFDDELYLVAETFLERESRLDAVKLEY